METGITKMIGSELETRWLKELIEVNGRLDQAKTLQEYMDILADSRKWNSLAFNLRRFVYRRFADVAVETASGWQVTFEGKTYRFSPVTAFDDIPEVEKRRYAELLYRLTLKNRAFDRLKDGTHNEKTGVITKQQYLNYLNGKRPYRRQVFILALALGLDGDDMETFMNTLGESPVFNFRDARECIYYFCIALPQFRNQETAERLEAWYAGLEGTAMSEPAPREEGVHTTETLNWRLDDIIWGEYPDDAAREADFREFLQANRPHFTLYSKRARALLREELNTINLLDVSEAKRRNRRLSLEVFADVGTQEYIGPEVSRDLRGREIFGALMGDTVGGGAIRLNELRLDRRMTANFLDGAHLRSALFDEDEDASAGHATRREHVTKKDFLLLRFYKLTDILSRSDRLSATERLELLRQFQVSTDHILEQAGLPPIYVANPLDHTVMCALASTDPLGFFSGVYQTAAQKKGVKNGEN
jgi:hypothetical protein